MRAIPTSISLVFIALLASSTGAPAAAPPDTLSFQWPLPCEVEVREETTKRQFKVEVTYRMTIEPASALPGAYTVTRQDYKVLTMNGMDVSHPALRDHVAQFEATMAGLPEVYIDDSGMVVGIEDWDEYLTRMEPVIREIFRTAKADAATAEQILTMMRDPRARPAMEEKAMSFWNLWVGNWVGMPSTPGAEFSLPASLPLPWGDLVDIDYAIRTTAAEPNSKNWVRISCEGMLSGDDLVDAMRPGFERMQREMGASQPMDWEALRDASLVQNSWVVLDPATMRPREAYAEQGLNDFMVAGQTQTAETRHYTFVWDDAE
jgi:hypothetical protein